MRKILKKIIQSTAVSGGVSNTMGVTTSDDGAVLLDFSFEAVFYSVKKGAFTNYLSNEADFVDKFREIHDFVQKVKNKNFLRDMIRPPGMRHCHVVKEDDKLELIHDLVVEAIQRTGDQRDPEDIWGNFFGGEKLFQLGYEGGIRYFGIYDNTRNVFRIILIDYYHFIYNDETCGMINPRQVNFCTMTSGCN